MKKIKQLQNSCIFDGSVPQGTYKVEGIAKLCEVFWRTNTIKPCVGMKLLPTCKDSVITLKNSKQTICFNIVLYSKLSVEENLLFLNNYCRNLTGTNRLRFLTSHAKILNLILGDKFEEFYFNIIFKLNRVPEQFDVFYKGQRVVDYNAVKQKYKDNPKEFSLVSYQDLD